MPIVQAVGSDLCKMRQYSSRNFLCRMKLKGRTPRIVVIQRAPSDKAEEDSGATTRSGLLWRIQFYAHMHLCIRFIVCSLLWEEVQEGQRACATCAAAIYVQLVEYTVVQCV